MNQYTDTASHLSPSCEKLLRINSYRNKNEKVPRRERNLSHAVH